MNYTLLCIILRFPAMQCRVMDVDWKVELRDDPDDR